MASFEINKGNGGMTAFVAGGLDAPAPPAPKPPAAPAAAAPPAVTDQNLAPGGLGVLRAAAAGATGGLTAYQGTDLTAALPGSRSGQTGATGASEGGPSVYAGGDLTQSTEYKLYEAEVALTRAQQELDAAARAAKAELASVVQLAKGLGFAQGGELDALAPDQRRKTFDHYLSRAQAALGSTPPNAEHYRSYLSSALTVFNPTSEVQKRYYGPAVPGPEAGDVLAKLRALIKGSGYKGDAATNPDSLYSLRGAVIEARSKVDTLKNPTAQAQKVQSKAAEAEAAKAEAVALRDRYQGVRTENLSAVSSFESSARNQIMALMAQFANQPERVRSLTEALKLLAGAADAFRVSEYGQSKQFLDKLKQALKGVPGSELKGLEAIAQRVTQTQQVASQSWQATHKASRLAQEAERMRAGYLKGLA